MRRRLGERDGRFGPGHKIFFFRQQLGFFRRCQITGGAVGLTSPGEHNSVVGGDGRITQLPRSELAHHLEGGLGIARPEECEGVG